MKQVSQKQFEGCIKHKNTHDRVQPAMGMSLETKQTILCIYHTPKPSLWQRLKGWK